MDHKLKDWLKKEKNKYLLYMTAFILAIVMIAFGGQKTPQAGETALERKLTATLSRIDGVHKVTVAVSMEQEGADIFGSSGETGGVVVIADTAQNSQVKQDIYEAVSALTGVPYHRIKIFSNHKEE